MENILITGASRGIGREIALELGNENKMLFITGRDRRALEETGRMIKENGGKYKAITADLADSSEVENLISEIGSVKISTLINNAGMAITGNLDEITLEDWNKTFAVNVTAPFLLTKAVCKTMPKGGVVINILSVASKTGFAGWSCYCMSKYAMEGFSQSIKEEMRGKEIRVTNIYPGAIDTDIWIGIEGDFDRKKMMSATEVAKAVGYVLSVPKNVFVEDITITNAGGNLVE